MQKKEFEELINNLKVFKDSVKTCSFCFNPFVGKENLCLICKNNARNKNLLCVVEKEEDLLSIEKTKKYKGFYFILGGTVSKLRKEDLEKLRVKELEERIKNPEKFGIKGCDFKEIIVATNPTTEGEATALYIERKIKDIKMPNNKKPPKITHLGRGLPVGGELEYADQETLESAFEGRK